MKTNRIDRISILRIKKSLVCIGLSMLLCGCTRKEEVVLSLDGSSTEGSASEGSTDGSALGESAPKEAALEDGTVSAKKDTAVQENADAKAAAAAATQNTQEPDYAYVHIGGAVVTPGVYKVEADSRVYEVIELAGGFLPEACTDYVNQAQPVTDGLQLIIPTLEEVEAGGIPATEQGSTYAQGTQAAATTKPAPVNINTASKEVLCTLPGIGESRAEDIIRYREQNGAFRDTADIMQVDGIKEKAYAKIKEYITVK